LRAFFLREINEGAGVDFQYFEALEYLTADKSHKTVSCLGGIIELAILVVPNDQRIKGIAGSVTADDELPVRG